ncbi:MAG TPA: cell envelope integrity protein TolA [bacterium]|nr:cell envelope integrity protein TolA [bacterium]
MRILLMLFVLCGTFLLFAQETAAPATPTVGTEPTEVVPEASVPAQPSVEERLKALEDRTQKAEEAQTRLAEENKKLQEELAAKKTAEETKKPEPPKEEKKAVEFTPYGFIELLGWANDALFVGNDLTLYVSNEGQSTTGITAKGSRIGTKVAFPRLEEVVLSATMEIDFVANMADTGYAESYPMIRMRHAYMELAKTWGNSTLGFKAGQTWATATPTIWPALINPAVGWGIGNTWQRMPLVEFSFTQKFAETFAFTAQIAAARAMTGASANRNGFLEVNIDAGDASHIPQIQSQLSLKGAFSGIDMTVAAAGVWGRENYKGGVYPNNKKKELKYIGGLVDVGMVTGALKLSHQYAEIAGKFWWGQNLDVFGVFGGSLITENVSAATATAPEIKRVIGSQRALGWWAQLTMKPLKELNLNVGYSSEDPEEGQKIGNTLCAPLYFENAALWVSAFYTLFERMTVGLQWTQVQTKEFNTAAGRVSLTGNSIMGNVKLNF